MFFFELRSMISYIYAQYKTFFEIHLRMDFSLRDKFHVEILFS